MIIDRINRWVLNRALKARDETRGKITVTNQGFSVYQKKNDHFFSWGEIETISAIKTDAFIGDLISLKFTAESRCVASISEHDPEWWTVINGIKNNLSGALQYQNWSVRLVAGESAVLVYKRGEYQDIG